jgi:hypothetical protein
MRAALRSIAAGALLLLQLALASPAARADIPGTWSIEPSAGADAANLTLRFAIAATGSRHTTSFAIDPAALGIREALAGRRETGVRFVLSREAGSFACTGFAGNGRGAGSVVFTASDAFLHAMRERGFAGLDEEDALIGAAVDLAVRFVDDLIGAGYHRPSYRMLVVLRSMGIDGPYVRAVRAAFGRSAPLDAEQLIPLRSLDVSPRYLMDLRDAGLPPATPEAAIRARSLRVDAPYVRGLGRAGYAHLDFEDVLRLRAIGIDGAYIERVEAHGFPHPSLEQLIELKTMRIISLLAAPGR